MKKYFILLATLAATVLSCTKEPAANPVDNQIENRNLVHMTFSVGCEKLKATLNDDRSVSFAANDRIAVFANGNKYEFTTTAGGANAVFEGNAEDAATYYAVYPYEAAESASISEGVISGLTISKSSTGTAPGTFNSKKAVAVAVSTSKSLVFKQVTALLKFTVPASVTDLKEIVIFNRASELNGSLAGTFSVTPNADAAPTVVVTTAEGNPHQNGISSGSGTLFAPGDYYVPVLPATLSRGLELKIQFGADGTITRRALNGMETTLESGRVYNMGTVGKATRYVYDSFESNTLGDEYQGNRSYFSVAENPLKNGGNNSEYVLKVDMHNATWATGGNIQVDAFDVKKMNSAFCQNFTKLSVKVYYAESDAGYYPAFAFNKSGGAQKQHPARVNGTAVSDESSWASAFIVNDWNVLEWDSTQFNGAPTSFSGLSSFILSPFVDWSSSSIKPDGVTYHHTAYVDDIVFYY